MTSQTRYPQRHAASGSPNDIDKCTVVEDEDEVEVVLLDEANIALKG